MFPVYLITCTHPTYAPHIMPYVGCILAPGKTVKERFSDHLCGHGHTTYLNLAIRKHGKEWFTVEQIDAGNTPEQALWLEQWWIKRLGTQKPFGYNLTAGGIGTRRIPTKEHREKIAAASKRMWSDPETRARLLAAKKAAGISDEARKRMSNAASYKRSDETKARMSIAASGRQVSEETIQRLRESHKGRKHSEETRRRMSEAHKGRPKSEEHTRNAVEGRKRAAALRKAVQG